MDVAKAQSFLKRSHDALDNYLAAKRSLERETDHSELVRHWSQLLSEYRKFLRFSEQTARNYDRNSWADGLNAEVKDSKFLSYMYHARNADEHGVSFDVEARASSLNIGGIFSFAGDCDNITISDCAEVIRMPDGTLVEHRIDGSFSTKDGIVSAGWLRSEVPVSTTLRHLRLGSVVDRGREYPLPELGCDQREIACLLAQKTYNWMAVKAKALRVIVG